MYTAEPVDEPITFQIYSGRDGEFRWYRDDGESLNYQRGEYSFTRLRWNDAERRLVVEPDPASGGQAPAPATLRLRLVPQGTVRTIQWNGDRAEVTFR
jgi:alpha-D-xyloside xylohydrolase